MAEIRKEIIEILSDNAKIVVDANGIYLRSKGSDTEKNNKIAFFNESTNGQPERAYNSYKNHDKNDIYDITNIKLELIREPKILELAKVVDGVWTEITNSGTIEKRVFDSELWDSWENLLGSLLSLRIVDDKKEVYLNDYATIKKSSIAMLKWVKDSSLIFTMHSDSSIISTKGLNVKSVKNIVGNNLVYDGATIKNELLLKQFGLDNGKTELVFDIQIKLYGYNQSLFGQTASTGK